MKSRLNLFTSMLVIAIAHQTCGYATAKPSISDAERAELQTALVELTAAVKAAQIAVASDSQLAALLPDIDVMHKTLDWALHYDESLDPKHFATARQILKEGLARASQIQQGQTPWTTQTGKVIRGFRSKLDDSVHPYVINVPANWRRDNGVRRPLFLECPNASLVTELKVIVAGLYQGSGFADEDSFHLRAYTRGYNAGKFAGEVCIFEQLGHAQAAYGFDTSRVVLHGFSMGGSCTWHLAAHHPDQWVAALPGAGFADSEHFVKIWEWEKQPPPWHFELFHLYNATDIAGNIAMVPTFSYVGEKDSHRFSHDAMATACTRDGVPLLRILGPQTAHKYEVSSREELSKWLRPVVTAGRPAFQSDVRYATYSLRYNKSHWLTLDRLDEHWKRADILVVVESPTLIRVNTANLKGFTLEIPTSEEQLSVSTPITVIIDGQSVLAPAFHSPWKVRFFKTLSSWPIENGKQRPPTEVWNLGESPPAGLQKVHGISGPIDDAFMERFLFVRPTGAATHQRVGSWIDEQLSAAQAAWKRHFRGDVPIKDDCDVTTDDIAGSNLILWGDPQSNSLIGKVLSEVPLSWTKDRLEFSDQSFSAFDHVPALIYPNPLNPKRYIVINSGPTCSQAMHGTSALVTPKLPDLAVIDINTPPSPEAPGRIVLAEFFDEEWNPKAR